MNALDKLVKDCNAMDITNQIYTFGEAFLPVRAAVELRDLLRIKLAAKKFIKVWGTGNMRAEEKAILALSAALKGGE